MKKTITRIEIDDNDYNVSIEAEHSGPVSKMQRMVRRAASEPSANLNIRPPITTFNRFLQFCEKERMSYPEGLKELMDRVGV